MLQLKTVCIHGRDDHVFSVEVGEHLHESLSNSELHVIPDASHHVFEEEPGKIAEILLKLVF